MKILYVTSTPLEYSSSANMRNIALLKGLIENGNEIYTLSYLPESTSSYYNEGILQGIDFAKRYFIELGKMHSQFTTKKEDANTINKKIKSVIYKAYTAFKIYDSRKDIVNKFDKIKIEEKFDLIISSSDPKSSHLLVKKMIQKNPDITKRWIQYWGDPFLKDINRKTKMPEFFIKRAEEMLIHSCDKVVYVSPFTLEEQKNIYKKSTDKMYFLPVPYIKTKEYAKIENSKIKLGYFGDYYSSDRDIKTLYETIKKENIDITICGNSDVTLQEKDNIHILPRQKIEVVEELEKNINILICLCNKRGRQIPGKIYHYAATNKPILIILDGENKEELKKYFKMFNRYEMCENEEKSIKDAINKIIKENKNYEPLELLSCKKIAEKFVE